MKVMFRYLKKKSNIIDEVVIDLSEEDIHKLEKNRRRIQDNHRCPKYYTV